MFGASAPFPFCAKVSNVTRYFPGLKIALVSHRRRRTNVPIVIRRDVTDCPELCLYAVHCGENFYSLQMRNRRTRPTNSYFVRSSIKIIHRQAPTVIVNIS